MIKLRLTLIISVILIFAGTVRSYAQTEWDAALDRYEEICNACIELREMLGRGESVPSEKVSALLGEMKTLRETLKATTATMTPRQRKRYADIQYRYASKFGTEQKSPTEETPVLLPRAEKGIMDYAHSYANANLRCIQTHAEPPKQYQLFHTGISAVCVVSSDIQYGISVHARYRKWGGYVSATSNFKTTTASYICSSTGKIEGGGSFWGDGSSSHSVYTVSAGPSFRVCDFLDIYAGIGFSKRQTYWKDISGNWAQVSDLSGNHICGEAGARFIIKGICLTAGTKYVAKAFSPIVGIGYEF